MEVHKSSDRNTRVPAEEAEQHKEKIRWVKCVRNTLDLTEGKLYPVNPETGCITDDNGDERKIRNPQGNSYFWLEEVFTDED